MSNSLRVAGVLQRSYLRKSGLISNRQLVRLGENTHLDKNQSVFDSTVQETRTTPARAQDN
jgi:hypothetical protein